MKAVGAALDRMLEHMEKAPHVVRKYRIVSLDGSETLADFTEEADVAESEAKKIAMSMYLHRYNVMEQHEDNAWLSIWDK